MHILPFIPFLILSALAVICCLISGWVELFGAARRQPAAPPPAPRHSAEIIYFSPRKISLAFPPGGAARRATLLPRVSNGG